MSENNPMWTAKEGRLLCIEIERIIAPLGAHVALAGGVLIRGESNKDVDVLIYPHNSNSPIDVNAIISAIGIIGLRSVKEFGFTQSNDAKQVLSGEINGKRIDLFFLK